ncbi:hypothetical protein, partial [Bartonella sp. CB21SXKL]|uniref:hypothetical protein n=1 Tax=Bartonella sp. CB21SXKL TaxID=3243513 RepID=UPI0035D11715
MMATSSHIPARGHGSNSANRSMTRVSWLPTLTCSRILHYTDRQETGHIQNTQGQPKKTTYQSP